MRQPPLISIITPVYNRADCIGSCIESVSTQKCDVPYEHIIVDDGSTDNSFEIISAKASENNNIKAFRLKQNKGTNAARNAGLNAATGKFILLLDSDDQIADNALQFVAESISKNPQIKHFLFATDDRAQYYAAQGYAKVSNTILTFEDFLTNKVSGDFAHVLLRDTMLKYPFNEKIRIFEGIFFLSFYKEAGNILFINKTVLNRDRSRNDRVSYSLTADSKESLYRHISAIELCINRFYNDYIKSEGGKKELCTSLIKYHKFASLLGEHKQVRYCEAELNKLGASAPKLYSTLDRLHLGPLFFMYARLYVKAKYKFIQVE